MVHYIAFQKSEHADHMAIAVVGLNPLKGFAVLCVDHVRHSQITVLLRNVFQGF